VLILHGLGIFKYIKNKLIDLANNIL